jgi:hypothetical protein
LAFTDLAFRDQLIRWIISANQPFTAVEDPEFQQLIKLCNSSAKMPSADTVKNSIMKNFNEEKLKIRILLQV